MLPVACVWNTWDGAAGVEGTDSSQVQKIRLISKEFYLVFLFLLCLFF